MPTLNVCVQIYMNKKNTKFIKITNISLLFRSFVSGIYSIIPLELWIQHEMSYRIYTTDKASEKKKNICNFNNFFFIHIYLNTHI